MQCGTAQGTLQAFPQVLVQAGTATENESLALAVFCTSTLCHPKCSVQPKHKAGRLNLATDNLQQVMSPRSVSEGEAYVFFQAFSEQVLT